MTVGGAIAADVHGKNHHRDGSFCRHVVEMTLVTPDGHTTRVPRRDPELFWATAGGMGLTGVVVGATLLLIPVETSWMEVDSRRFDQLDDLMSAMEATDDRYRYWVAWLDCVAHRGGRHRSVLTRGDHASCRRDPRTGWRGRSPGSPEAPAPGPPRRRLGGLANRLSVRAFNEAWFRASPARRGARSDPCPPSSTPWTAWPTGTCSTVREGFVQYQFVVRPSGATWSRAPSHRSRPRGCRPSWPC